MPPKRRAQTPIALPAEDSAFIRLPTVLGVFPVGETSWWKGVAEGRYPRPIKLSPRVNGWRVADIRKLLASMKEP